MNAPLFFESAGDERGTPDAFFQELDKEFGFELDAAANKSNYKCCIWLGPGSIHGEDALAADWCGLTTFLNPPYSMCGKFVAKAWEEAQKGARVVLLLPVRSDTQWWHTYVWDKDARRTFEITAEQLIPGAIVELWTPRDGDWRPGVRGRLLPGRLGFTLSVSDEQRAWIKDCRLMVPDIVKATGIPKMAVERILKDFPNDKLLESAPFPSCVLIFEKV